MCFFLEGSAIAVSCELSGRSIRVSVGCASLRHARRRVVDVVKIRRARMSEDGTAAPLLLVATHLNAYLHQSERGRVTPALRKNISK